LESIRLDITYFSPGSKIGGKLVMSIMFVLVCIMSIYSDGSAAAVPAEEVNQYREMYKDSAGEEAGEIEVKELVFIEGCFKNPETGLHDSYYTAFSNIEEARKKCAAYQKMVIQMAKIRDKYLEIGPSDEIVWTDFAAKEDKVLSRLKEKYFAIRGERMGIYSSVNPMESGYLYARSPQLPGRLIQLCCE